MSTPLQYCHRGVEDPAPPHRVYILQGRKCILQPKPAAQQRERPPAPLPCGQQAGGDGLPCPSLHRMPRPVQESPLPTTSFLRWQQAFGTFRTTDCAGCADRQLGSDVQVRCQERRSSIAWKGRPSALNALTVQHEAEDM